MVALVLSLHFNLHLDHLGRHLQIVELVLILKLNELLRHDLHVVGLRLRVRLLDEVRLDVLVYVAVVLPVGQLCVCYFQVENVLRLLQRRHAGFVLHHGWLI